MTTSNLDGTFYAVKLVGRDGIEEAWLAAASKRMTQWVVKEQRTRFLSRAHASEATGYAPISSSSARIIRLRPRVSLVRATKLLWAAHKKGVLLRMRMTEEDDSDRIWWQFWGSDVADTKGHPLVLGAPEVFAKWIVATVADAARLDARRAKT